MKPFSQPRALRSDEIAGVIEEYRQACEAGISPDQVADCVFQAVQDGKFYILTHPEFTPLVEARMAALGGPYSSASPSVAGRASSGRGGVRRPTTYRSRW